MMKKSTIFSLLILCISLITIVITPERIGFETGHHGYLSSHGAVLSKNVKAKNHFFMYTSVTINNDNEKRYTPYNNFFFISFYGIKIFSNLFSHDLKTYIISARILMRIFFSLSMIVSYILIKKLFDEKTGFISVTIIYSSFFLQYYNDMIFNDGMVLFFFMVLILAIYCKLHDKITNIQLIIISFISLCIGWQPFFIILSWALIELIWLVLAKSEKKLTDRVISFLKTDGFKIAIITFVFMIVLILFNIMNEKVMTKQSFSELNIINSIKNRTGIEKHPAEIKYQLKIMPFLYQQIKRLLVTLMPGICIKFRNNVLFYALSLLVFVGGICLTIHFCKVNNKSVNEKKIILILLVSPLTWNIVMKNFVEFHDFQSIYYVSSGLLLYAMIVRYIKKDSIIILLIVLSLIVYISSVFEIKNIKDRHAEIANAMLDDFENIQDTIGTENTLYLHKKEYLATTVENIVAPPHIIDYYLSGNYYSSLKNAEFIISRTHDFNSELLTPHNSYIFLFENK